MSQNTRRKESLSKKYNEKIEQDLDELKKRRKCLGNLTPSVVEEIRYKIELINYLTAELENTKAELSLLKQSAKNRRNS